MSVLQQRLAGIKAIIWDFDGVFYDKGSIPNFYDICLEENVAAACEVMPGLSPEEAAQLSAESYAEFHDVVSGFMKVATRFDKTREEVRLGIHALYHQKVAKRVLQTFPHVSRFCSETVTQFRSLQIQHALATHSCARNWAKPILQSQGVADHFAEEFLLGYEDFDWEPKGVSARAIDVLLHRLRLPASQVAFVEDDAKNMLPAKEKHPDLLTVLKTNSDEELQHHVDMRVRNPLDFLWQIPLAPQPLTKLEL